MEIGLSELLTLVSKFIGPAAAPLSVIGWWMWYRADKMLQQAQRREREQAGEYAASIHQLVNANRWMRFMMVQGRVPGMAQYELEDVSELLAVPPPKLTKGDE
jgi:hypothetical protein